MGRLPKRAADVVLVGWPAAATALATQSGMLTAQPGSPAKHGRHTCKGARTASGARRLPLPLHRHRPVGSPAEHAMQTPQRKSYPIACSAPAT